MKVRFQPGDTNAILGFICNTVELMAQGRYKEALAPIENSPYSPDELEKQIATYFNDGVERKVTKPGESGAPLPNQREHLEDEDDEFISIVHDQFPFCVCWNKEGREWSPLYAHADLPLNDSWEDRLTLKFDFAKRGNGYAIYIEDIEVM